MVDVMAYTVREFCEAYRVSRAHVYRQIKAGQLQKVKTGGRTLIPAASARAWFAALQDGRSS